MTEGRETRSKYLPIQLDGQFEQKPSTILPFNYPSVTLTRENREPPLGKIGNIILEILDFWLLVRFSLILPKTGQKQPPQSPGGLPKASWMHWDPFWLSISPNGATGTHFRSISMIFLSLSDDHFYENKFFLKKSISGGSSGQSAKLKMTAYRSSNSEVLTVF